MKLLLASLAHVHVDGVTVHNHGRFVRVTADVRQFSLKNIVSVFRKVLHTYASQFDTHSCLTQSVISAVHNEHCAVQLHVVT